MFYIGRSSRVKREKCRLILSRFFNIRELTIDLGFGFLVEFPDYPGIIGTGDTVAEAIADAGEALGGFISGV
jgi:hypothetical protein